MGGGDHHRRRRDPLVPHRRRPAGRRRRPSPERYVEASGPPGQRDRLEGIVTGSDLSSLPGTDDDPSPQPGTDDDPSPQPGTDDQGAAGQEDEGWAPFDEQFGEQFDEQFGGEFDGGLGQWGWLWGFGGLPGEPDQWGEVDPPADPEAPGTVPPDLWGEMGPFGGPGLLDGLDELLGGMCVDVHVWSGDGDAWSSPWSGQAGPDAPAELEQALAGLWRELWLGDGSFDGYDDAVPPDTVPPDAVTPDAVTPDAVPPDADGGHWRHITGSGDCPGAEDPTTSTTDADYPTTSTTDAQEPTTSTSDAEDPAPSTAPGSSTDRARAPRRRWCSPGPDGPTGRVSGRATGGHRLTSAPVRWSQAFIPTLRDAPADAEAASHKLLVRAGFVRQLMPGAYSLLPLGQRVHREDRAASSARRWTRSAAQEFLLPALHPAEIWKQSGRWDAMGEEMFRLRDRRRRRPVRSA